MNIYLTIIGLNRIGLSLGMSLDCCLSNGLKTRLSWEKQRRNSASHLTNLLLVSTDSASSGNLRARVQLAKLFKSTHHP